MAETTDREVLLHVIGMAAPELSMEQYHDALYALDRVAPEHSLQGPTADDERMIAQIMRGHGDWWTAIVLRLCHKSDPQHLEALRVAAPEHVAAYERWRQGS